MNNRGRSEVEPLEKMQTESKAHLRMMFETQKLYAPNVETIFKIPD